MHFQISSAFLSKTEEAAGDLAADHATSETLAQQDLSTDIEGRFTGEDAGDLAAASYENAEIEEVAADVAAAKTLAA